MGRDELRRLGDYIAATLPDPWPTWPGGWPGQTEAAVLDAVLSICARYGGPHTGVRAAVARYRASISGGPAR